MAKLHWTQTPEGKAKMSAAQKRIWEEKRSNLQKIAKTMTNGAKRGPYKKRKEGTSVVINGWRITLGTDEVKIERE